MLQKKIRRTEGASEVLPESGSIVKRESWRRGEGEVLMEPLGHKEQAPIRQITIRGRMK